MALVPKERSDDHHVAKHAAFLALPDRHLFRTVLLGDSLTRRWEDHPEQWNRYFGEQSRAANLGVGQDTLENVLWRVQNGELKGMAPRVVVLLAGTNNLPTDTPEHIAAGIAELVQAVLDQLPGSQVLLLGLFPRNRDASGIDFRQKIDQVNARISLLGDGRRVHYRSWGSLFDADGAAVNPLVMPDGLHLNAAGYDLLGPVLTQTLKELEA